MGLTDKSGTSFSALNRTLLSGMRFSLFVNFPFRALCFKGNLFLHQVLANLCRACQELIAIVSVRRGGGQHRSSEKKIQ